MLHQQLNKEGSEVEQTFLLKTCKAIQACQNQHRKNVVAISKLTTETFEQINLANEGKQSLIKLIIERHYFRDSL